MQLTKLVEPESAAAPEEPAEGEDQERINLDAVVGILIQMVHHSSVHTKVAALDWFLHLYSKLPNQVSALENITRDFIVSVLVIINWGGLCPTMDVFQLMMMIINCCYGNVHRGHFLNHDYIHLFP